MNELTPTTVREAAITSARQRLDRLSSMTRSADAGDTEFRLATVILVAEVLRDVEVLVTEPLLWTCKQKLLRALPRIASCKESHRLAALIQSFAAEASSVLPRVCPYDPENPPF